MKKVLIINPYYLPGFKSGGPQRTVENIVETYGDDCKIYILTQNHDLGSPNQYSDVDLGKWNKVGKAKVRYVSSNQFKWKAITEAYNHFDIIYSCGLFEINSISLLLIHRLRRNGKKKIFIAPMGVFSEGAINNKKKLKKKIFIKAFKFIGAFKEIIWSFTSLQEKTDAVKTIGIDIQPQSFIIATDIPRKVSISKYEETTQKYTKCAGELHLVFISRICAQKNLLYALNALTNRFDGKIYFDIYGVIEDTSYWDECKEIINKTPINVSVKYCGTINPEDVIDTFTKYDAFLFPTKGENFGHVIYESMAAGCVPIISDQTPWDFRSIDGIKLVYSLDNEDGFSKTINDLIKLDSEKYRILRYKVLQYARDSFLEITRNSGYSKIFQDI